MPFPGLTLSLDKMEEIFESLDVGFRGLRLKILGNFIRSSEKVEVCSASWAVNATEAHTRTIVLAALFEE